MEERARRLEFSFEEPQAFGLRPFLPLAGVNAYGAKELDQGFGVKSRILADIQTRKVEPEHLQGAAHWRDVGLREPLGANLFEGLAEDSEVVLNLLRGLIKAVAREDLGELIGNHLHGDPFEHQFDKASPRFTAVLF